MKTEATKTTKVTYEELVDRTKNINNSIIDVNKRMSLADSPYELAELSAELDFYENELTMVEDYINRIVSKGRK